MIVYGMSMVDETSALLQYKDIRKASAGKAGGQEKDAGKPGRSSKLCSSLREAVAAYEKN
ncbi:MAG: hypothetical protein ACLR3S_06350 [Clostridium fessum]